MSFFHRLVFFLGVVFLGCAAWPAMALPVSVSTNISQEEYWKFVKDSQEIIKSLEGLPDEEIKQSLESLAAQWEAITEVEVDSLAVPVDNRYLVRMMRDEQPDLEKINGILTAFLKAHQTYPVQVFSSADLDPLHDILSRSEFAWPEPAPNPLADWFQKMWDAINRWLDNILGRRTNYISINTNWLNAASLILLIIVFIFLARTLFIDLAADARFDNHGKGDEEPLTSEVAFKRAQTLSQGGDYRSAVRYLYLSALLIMDERGVLRYDRSKTNREYLRSVAESPELAEPLEEVIDVFDDVWYGQHSLEDDTFKHYSERVEELKEKKA